METIVEALKINFFQHQDILTLLESNKKAVANNEISPFTAAQNILKIYWSKK
jgi:LAO/AO transport system kinase